jgi:hypothetical protein
MIGDDHSGHMIIAALHRNVQAEERTMARQGFRLVAVGGGMAQICDAEGRKLEFDGEAVEVAMPVGGPGGSSSVTGEIDRLRAENERLSRELKALDEADARDLSGRRRSTGLDRASLRRVLANSPEGQEAIRKLDSGELSWDTLVEPTAEALAR